MNNYTFLQIAKGIYFERSDVTESKNVQDILIKQSNVVQMSGTSLQKLTKCDKKMDLSSEMIPENKEKVQYIYKKHTWRSEELAHMHEKKTVVFIADDKDKNSSGG